MSLNMAPLMARHRRVRINGIFYHVNMPRTWSEQKVLRSILISMPSSVSRILASELGTEKLQRQLAEPHLIETEEPAIVRFYRTTLLSDLRIRGWVKTFSDLAVSFRSSPYLLEAALKKMSSIYSIEAIDKDSETVLRVAIAESVATLRGQDHKERTRIKSDQMQKIDLQRSIHMIKTKQNDKKEGVVDAEMPADAHPILVPEQAEN